MWRPVIFLNLKPLPNCNHGQKKDLKWWQLDWLRVSMNRTPYIFDEDGLRTGVHQHVGWRWWLYTKWGGFHFDLIFRKRLPLDPQGAEYNEERRAQILKWNQHQNQ